MEYIELELDSNAADFSASTGLSRLNNPQFTIGKELENIKGFKLTEISVPFSWYTIPADPNYDAAYPTYTPFPPAQFNQFRLSDTYPLAPLADEETFTIPAGNYTATELATEISNILSDPLVQPSLTAIIGGAMNPPHTMVYNETTRKFVLTINTALAPAGTSYFDVFGLASNTKRIPLQGILGISSTDAIQGVNNAAGYVTYTFPDIANLSGPNYLYVNSEKLGVIAKAYLPQGTAGTAGQTNPQIAMIPLNVNPGSVITWQDPSPTEYFNFENLFRLDRFDLYLTHGTMTLKLDLNGIGFMVKISLLIANRFAGESVSGTVGSDRVVKRIRAQ